jgi:hypothetical protein
MAWFQRDHTGRRLTSTEQAFLTALILMLEDMRPTHLEETETAITAEASTCLIALMPHRALGGVAIVVWLFSDHADVTWAQVADLRRDHDSLDLGVRVATFRLDPGRLELGPLLECIRAQFTAPLIFKLRGGHATLWVSDHGGVLQKVGTLGVKSGVFERLWRRVPTQETVVRFNDAIMPPLTEPSGVDYWFTTGV